MATFVVYKDPHSEYRWRLLANNNRIIADSGEGYKNKSDCEDGIKLVKQQAPLATVKEQ
jgi:hypothetical protein